MKFYTRWLADYMGKTRRLNLMQHGAYTVMLDNFYLDEGPLPNNEIELFALCKAISTEEQDAVRFVRDKFWRQTPKGLVNDKAIEVMNKGNAFSEKQAQKANKRWEKERAKKATEHAGASTVAHAGVVPGDMPTHTPYPITQNSHPGRTSSSCTDLQAGSAPKNEIIRVPLQKNGDEIIIDQRQVDEWAEAFPHLDIMQELRSMRQWCIVNPGKRKTARGFQRFAVNWLTRSQDRGNGKKTKAPISDPFSWMEKTQ